MKKVLLTGFLLSLILFYSCDNGKESPVEPELQTGHITLTFEHFVDSKPLQKDQMIYANAAGNPYEINEVMYFISNLTLFKSDGTEILIDDWKDIHYVDIDIPTTLIWKVYDDIPFGEYDSVTFVFGIPGEKNESFMFVNPPEDKMMWPDILGGGYHYMMINGRWRDENDKIKLFNFHMGIGQLYKGNVINYDSIYAYVQNYFTVSLPGSSFILEPGETKTINIGMNIESWFETPHNFDFNYWGGDIMEKQPAMQMAKENGFDVFEIMGSIR